MPSEDHRVNKLGELSLPSYRKVLSVFNDTIYVFLMKDEFEDNKGVIRIRKSKKDRQHNGQKKKDKRTNKEIQNIDIKLKIE